LLRAFDNAVLEYVSTSSKFALMQYGMVRLDADHPSECTYHGRSRKLLTIAFGVHPLADME
jgi:hypothetical protein